MQRSRAVTELSGRFPPDADLETAWDLGLGALAVNRAADRR